MIYSAQGFVCDGGPDDFVRAVMSAPKLAQSAVVARNWLVAESEIAAIRRAADDLGFGGDDFLSTRHLAVLPGGRLVRAHVGVPRGHTFDVLAVIGNVDRRIVDAALAALRPR